MGFIYQAACFSNVGRIRKNNEDNFYFAGKKLPQDNLGLKEPLLVKGLTESNAAMAVFDGMGGESYGEVASFVAAQEMQRLYAEGANRKMVGKREVAALTQKLNSAVVAAAQELGTDRMGSTQVSLHLTQNSAMFCNVGDSRAYRLRAGTLTQLSVDHSDPRPLKPGRKAPLTQHLGIDPEEMIIEPAISQIALRDGDLFLLCSDGVTDMVPEDEIVRILQENTDLRECVLAMTVAAMNHGGRDNITLIVCRISYEEKPLEPASEKAVSAPVQYSESAEQDEDEEGSSGILRVAIVVAVLAIIAAILATVFAVGSKRCLFGHKWVDPTCEAPKTCAQCHKTEGESLGHIWKDADCVSARGCARCGKTDGTALGHIWMDATCTTPSVCSRCGAANGDAPGHAWMDASCEFPKTCMICGETEGEPLGHNLDNLGVCIVCGYHTIEEIVQIQAPEEQLETPAESEVPSSASLTESPKKTVAMRNDNARGWVYTIERETDKLVFDFTASCNFNNPVNQWELCVWDDVLGQWGAPIYRFAAPCRGTQTVSVSAEGPVKISRIGFFLTDPISGYAEAFAVFHW